MADTELDTKIVPKVLAVIARVGIPATWTPSPTRVLNRTTRAVVETPATPVSVTVTPPAPITARKATALGVVAHAMEVLCAGSGLSFTPEDDQVVTLLGRTYKVVRADPLYSGTQIAAWDVFLATY